MFFRVCVVNSNTFGKYVPEVLSVLSSYGEVHMLSVAPNSNYETLIEQLHDFDAIIASTTPRYSREFMECAMRLKIISRHGIGVDNIDIEAATENGILVTAVPRELEREAVAEHAVALLLAAVRRIVAAHVKTVEGGWKERGRFIGFELTGKNVLVVGFGNIGSRVSEILTGGFGARVSIFDPYVSKSSVEAKGFKYVTNFLEGLSDAHVITFHVPLTEETRHLMDEDAFKKVKSGVIIINTSRGEVIDTRALVEALERGVVGAAGLDVFEDEPLQPGSPLTRFENVVLTPHISAYTLEGLRAMDMSVTDDVISVFKGKTPKGLVNKEVILSKMLRVKLS
ncbi:MAG: NAD(P)-dependent oxidoreductase [Thermoproteota archaeon]